MVPDPSCTRSAVTGRTVQAEAGLCVVLVFMVVVGCGGGWLGVAFSVGCADVWCVFLRPSLVFASPRVGQFSAVSGGTSLPVRAQCGAVTSAPVGDSSRWFRGDES